MPTYELYILTGTHTKEATNTPKVQPAVTRDEWNGHRFLSVELRTHIGLNGAIRATRSVYLLIFMTPDRSSKCIGFTYLES